MIEEGAPVDSIYLDFRKAFDSVPHQRLLRKLRAHGIAEQVIKWIEAFLSGRKQQVVVNGHHSGWAPVTSGVPQGSVLGPLLFLVFINDIPGVIGGLVKMFADDTKLYRSVSLPADADSLQADIDAVVAWSDKWQMPFNEGKCKVLHLGGANSCHQYTMRGINLEETDTERDLGIHVDSVGKMEKCLFHDVKCIIKFCTPKV